jgi:tRNA(Arg) A34 adenosine deaminase TadA
MKTERWDMLCAPWQAAFEMAWEAYCTNTIPIGAVIADAQGNILARGRNRIMDKSAPEHQVCSNELAHAEINALLALKLGHQECRERKVALYTTMEPCPLCMGALYMSDVKILHYAARDPWAGSVNLLGTTPYLSRKPIQVVAPSDSALEDIFTAMHIEHSIRLYGEETLSSPFHEKIRAELPQGVSMGVTLFRSGELLAARGKSAEDAFEFLWGKRIAN